ncbi:MAG TPA: family 2A encapsulin nanocompartment cargo protein cysteine desulfurase [Terriglobales bacterium]|nr:family 2A encapsulin nanocompartment cargo protein cysteine desulfurase [Terriglobales bacterium]
MSTNEPGAGAGAPASPGNWTTVPNGTSTPAGVLDPAILARMANQVFSALPEFSAMPAETFPAGTQVPAGPATPPPQIPNVLTLQPDVSATAEPRLAAPATSQNRNTAPGAAAPSSATMPAIPGSRSVANASPGPGFSFLEEARPLLVESVSRPGIPTGSAQAPGEYVPAEADFQTLPFDLDDPSLLPALATDLQPSTPTIPSAFGAVDSSAFPTFSFLEEARPLLFYPPKIPGPVPSFPTEAELATPGNPQPPKLPTVESFGDVAAPQVPGAVVRPAIAPTMAAPFGFLDQVRPISRVDAVPLREPIGLELDVPAELNLSSYPFDVQAVRRDFPILGERVNGRPLVWLDSAATTQKPQSVIDRLSYFYEHENSNVHRAAHELAARATDAYESARDKVRRFLNAAAVREIVFVRGATEGINLVAQSWGRRNIQKDDEIVITWLEHHANIVPWQMLCAEKGARLRVAPVDDSGQVLLDEYEKLLNPKTRLVALPQVSNALGTVTPFKEMIEPAHRHGARVLLDGAQAVSHMRVDVQALNCDFFVLSGHKMFAPTGIGVVYGKSEVLDNTPPWQGGGSMIQDVTFEKTIYQPPPQRFEAGTGNIADAVGLGAAVDYLDRIGMVNVARHEHELLVYATNALERIPGFHMIGTAREKAGVLSFILDGFRPEEIGDFLNRNGIAVRAGHHCAQPILRRFGLESTVRASLGVYNTCEDIDALVAALWSLKQGRNPGLQ